MPESVPSFAQLADGARTVLVAEITCLFCGHLAGMAVSDRWPPIGSVLFQPANFKSFRRMSLRELRCAVCGGNTAASDVTTRHVRNERPIDWEADLPKRGRPAKWRLPQQA